MDLSHLEQILDLWEERNRPVLELQWRPVGRENWKVEVTPLHQGIEALYFLHDRSRNESDLNFDTFGRPPFYIEIKDMPVPIGFTSSRDAMRYEVAWLGQGGPPMGKMVWEGDRVTVSLWYQGSWTILYADG